MATALEHIPQQHRPPGMDLLAEMARKTSDPQAVVEIARQIVELQTRWESLHQSAERFEWEKYERNAKVAFVQAFKAFKDDAPKILKTKHVEFKTKAGDMTSYWHVELDKAVEVLGPALAKVGITYRWKPTDLPGGMTRVTCYLRHEMGYEEEGASLAGPTDQSGGKNAIQGVGSSTEYLKRYTLLASLGVVAANSDNDGATLNGITAEVGAELIRAIESANTPIEVMKTYQTATNEARKFTPPDYKAITLFTEARDARMLALKKGEK